MQVQLHIAFEEFFFSFVFVSHSYYKVFSLQCLLFALAYWNVVFLKPVHFKVWLSFLLQANGACFMNLIWSRHHFLMLKVIVKQRPTLVDQSNVPNIWFQWVDNLLMFGLSQNFFFSLCCWLHSAFRMVPPSRLHAQDFTNFTS